ncbi:MAG: iron chelate uptake ABC transporter family permease subunit [Anaerolineales bacterium]|jgi:iron complex transport system permease protein
MAEVKKKRFSPWVINLSLLLLFFVINIAVGAVFIPPETLLKILLGKVSGVAVPGDWPAHFEAILLSIRLPHAVLIMMTGAALASSGAAYQGLFRNPLADPYLIGVASGAGLGAVAALSIYWPQDLLGFYLIPLSAFAGAILTVVVVYYLAKIGNMVPLTTLILAGVAVGAFASALTSFLMLNSDDQIYRAISFLLGGTPMAGWNPVLAALPYLVVGMGVLSLLGHPLNLLQFGEEQAQQLGLSVERAKTIIIIVASIVTAVAVSFSGVIGFIGLIVPHVLRLVTGPDYRKLLPLSILAGGTALLAADVVARWVMAPRVLPVGIITALAGAPFFLWILRRAKTEVFW